MSRPSAVERATQMYWRVSCAYNGRPGAKITTSEATRGLGQYLPHLNPQRLVAKKALYLQHYIITGERPCLKGKIKTSAPSKLIQRTQP